MIYDRAKYERLIMDSTLFQLDKEKEYTAYKRESYRMIEYIYCYLMAINEKEYEPYGCEITEVATRCINNYDASKGIFLHYFNAAWKQEYSHILGDRAQEEKYRGMKISEEDSRAIKKYMRLMQQIGTRCTEEDLRIRLSEAMGVPVEKIYRLQQLSSVYVSGESYVNNEGEEHSILEQIADGFVMGEKLESEIAVAAVLSEIDKVFGSLQERQKPLIADLLTIKICTELIGLGAEYSFVSQEVIDDWKKTGIVPSQRDIAQKYNRDEASISRTYKDFIKKVKERNGYGIK